VGGAVTSTHHEITHARHGAAPVEAKLKRNRSWVLQAGLFVAFALVFSAGLAWAGSTAFAGGGKSRADYLAKVGELFLQLAVIVVVGGLAKAVIDWGVAIKTRAIERNEQRLDLLRRLRAVHVAVSNARDLLNAHGSAKTWSEQMRRVMGLRTEVEELSEDVKASTDLFSQKVEICKGLEEIVRFLKNGRDEYVAHHRNVDADFKRDKDGYLLSKTIEDQKMDWVRELMESGARFESYTANLVKAKVAMRNETFGSE
jgi:hypothetical protein